MKPEVAFGKILRSSRSKKGWSQETLGLNCDLDRTFISMLERGVRQPSLGSIISIAVALEIPPDQLIKLTINLLNEENNL